MDRLTDVDNKSSCDEYKEMVRRLHEGRNLLPLAEVQFSLVKHEAVSVSRSPRIDKEDGDFMRICVMDHQQLIVEILCQG